MCTMAAIPNSTRAALFGVFLCVAAVAPASGVGIAPWIPDQPAAGRLYTATVHAASPGLDLARLGGRVVSKWRPRRPLDARQSPATCSTLWPRMLGGPRLCGVRTARGSSAARTAGRAGPGWQVWIQCLGGNRTSPTAILPSGDILMFHLRRVSASADGGVTWAIVTRLGEPRRRRLIQAALAPIRARRRSSHLSIFGPRASWRCCVARTAVCTGPSHPLPCPTPP